MEVLDLLARLGIRHHGDITVPPRPQNVRHDEIILETIFAQRPAAAKDSNRGLARHCPFASRDRSVSRH
ncbi:MAG: hypothetical protein C0606_08750 [Hyphomicrobiales bacterium]|nr:MAG: hypothetical protein C0606_08750 [Hyphomicrobiales bacterium]